MSGEPQYSVVTRRADGKFRNFSEGIKVPELVALIQHKHVPAIAVLPDFAPLLEQLHSLHAEYHEHQIEIAYSTLFYLWRDANTFTDKDFRKARCHNLIERATQFLHELRAPSDATATAIRTAQDENNRYFFSERLEHLGDLYIVGLLCAMHSKASLELSSFKRERALTDHAYHLLHLVQQIYHGRVGYSVQQGSLSKTSVLYSLAMARHDEVDSLLSVLPAEVRATNLRVQYLDINVGAQYQIIGRDGYSRVLPGVIWERVSDWEISALKRVRNLLQKIQRVIAFLKRLKAGDVQWDLDGEVEALLACQNSISFSPNLKG